jgi:hypothetical protein
VVLGQRRQLLDHVLRIQLPDRQAFQDGPLLAQQLLDALLAEAGVVGGQIAVFAASGVVALCVVKDLCLLRQAADGDLVSPPLPPRPPDCLRVS